MDEAWDETDDDDAFWSALAARTRRIESALDGDELSGVSLEADGVVTNVRMVSTMVRALAGELHKASSQAGDHETKVGTAMDEMHELSARMESLEAILASISGVVESISAVALQTKILSLNAAIEAAHAGEAGRGFAVVASSVGDLAKQTTDATREVSEGIRSISTAMGGVRDTHDRLQGDMASMQEASATFTRRLGEQGRIADTVKNSAETAAGTVERIARDVQQVAARLGQARRETEALHGMVDGDVGMVLGDPNPSPPDDADPPPAAKPTDGELLAWSPALSVGVAAFDEEHRTLIDMINDLYRAVLTDDQEGALGTILEGLVDYTVNHFAHEDEEMERHRYPDLDQHRAEHTAFTTQVGKVKERFEAGERTVVSLELMEFLKRWLVNHIQGTDQRYSDFFQECGVS